MIKCLTGETLAVWVLPREINFTPRGSTVVEGLLITRRRTLAGLSGLLFVSASSPYFIGEDAIEGKHQAKQPSQGNHDWNEHKVHDYVFSNHSEKDKVGKLSKIYFPA